MAKGKKQRKTEDSDEEIVVESDQETESQVASAGGKKGKKDRKKKKEAELEEAQKELDAIAAGDDDLVVEEEKDKKKSGKKSKKEKKKKVESSDDEEEASAPVVKKSGFSAFLMDDSEDDHAVDSDEAPVIIKAEPEPKKEAESKSKKDKKKKKKKKDNEGDEEDELEKALAELNIESKADDEEAKAAAQKKKEKKERKKQKQKEPENETKTEEPKEETKEEKPKEEEKKGKGKKEDAKKGKKPGKGTLAAMQEALKKVQEEQERAKKEEEERIRKEEEAEKERLEKKRIEEEKKALKKQREKERKEQLRKEGKLLTAKQKADKARAEQFLAARRAQGLDVPEIDAVKRGPRPGTRIRNKNKAKSQTPETDDNSKEEVLPAAEEEKAQEREIPPQTEEPPEEPKEEILDSWDAESDKEEEEEKEEPKEEKKEEESSEESESEESDSESDDESSDSEDSEEEEHVENKRERAILRIEKRKAENEANRTTEVLRAPVVVVMGHVDTGKTKILDKLRRTNVQDGEAGGITQQIGATNVPIEVVHEQCKMAHDYDKPKVILPGLLIIDTPGHESFSNLRDRGSSLCDIAILVVDIMHCLEPQTIESINLLRKKKVPFVIALNKIDRLYEWKSNKHKDVKDVIASQSSNTRMEFDKRSKEVVTAMAEQGLNCALFYENPDPKSYISMVPTSAHSGDGMGNLMALLVKLSQNMLAKRLSYSNELQATVLEVKAIPGLGTTIDIVLVNGTLREGQTVIVAGSEGPIVTQIRSLLTPAKMQDLRVKNQYVEHKEISAAQGVKICAKELEKTVAGLNMLVAHHPDEVEICKEEMEKRLSSVLSSFKVKDRGVFVQASTLGSLEALLEFLRTSKIPYAGVKIGPVVKRDVMRASVMLEHEPKYTIILAFDVKVERDAQDLANKEGVKIFQADIIYHLFDQFTAYQDELKRQKREEFKNIAVFPCKFKILPNFVFNSRDPIVAGVNVEAGIIKAGTPVCVPSKSFLDIGIVTGIQNNNKEVDSARKGEEVCIKIEPIPGESPKLFGRHFDETDTCVSKISRASIDACKDYFRDDLQKSDWQLMVELKKVFEIL